MTTESSIQKAVQIMASKLGMRLFRNNVGKFYTGRHSRITKPTQFILMPGDVLIRSAYPVSAGLCEGSSDLIGFTPITITPDMVGKQVSVFTALEVKTQSGRTTKEQENFIKVVQQAGGIARVIRSDNEIQEVIDEFIFSKRS